MPKDSTKKELVRLTVDVTQRVAEAMERCLEADIARGLTPSMADIHRRALVHGLEALGFPPSANGESEDESDTGHAATTA